MDERDAADFVGAPGLAGADAAMIASSSVREPESMTLTAATLNLNVSPGGERPLLT